MKKTIEVAFFDFDNTLIPYSSGTILIKHFVKLGFISRFQALKLSFFHLLFRFGLVDVRKRMQSLLKNFEGVSQDKLEQVFKDLFDEKLKSALSDSARREIEYHRAKNRKIVMVSNNLLPLLSPTIKEWHFDDIIANEYLVKDGLLTGDYSKDLCVEKGKYSRLKDLTYFEQIDFQNSFFYTDSYYDLALLEKVGRPKPVNVDFKLRLWAKVRGHQIVSWR